MYFKPKQDEVFNPNNVIIDKYNEMLKKHKRKQVTRDELINYISDPICYESLKLFKSIVGDLDTSTIYPRIIRSFNVDGTEYIPTPLEEFLYNARLGLILGIEKEYFISKIDDVLKAQYGGEK